MRSGLPELEMTMSYGKLARPLTTQAWFMLLDKSGLAHWSMTQAWANSLIKRRALGQRMGPTVCSIKIAHEPRSQNSGLSLTHQTEN